MPQKLVMYTSVPWTTTFRVPLDYNILNDIMVIYIKHMLVPKIATARCAFSESHVQCAYCQGGRKMMQMKTIFFPWTTMAYFFSLKFLGFFIARTGSKTRYRQCVIVTTITPSWISLHDDPDRRTKSSIVKRIRRCRVFLFRISSRSDRHTRRSSA